MPFLLETFYRHKTEGGRIHTVAQPGRWRTVLKDMTQMRIGLCAADFSEDRKPAPVLAFDYSIRSERLGETGPAGTRVVLVTGEKQGFTGDDIHLSLIHISEPTRPY